LTIKCKCRVRVRVMVKVRLGRCMVLDVWYKYSIGNPKANIYQYESACTTFVATFPGVIGDELTVF